MRRDNVKASLSGAQRATSQALFAGVVAAFLGGLLITWVVAEETEKRVHQQAKEQFLRANDRMVADAARRLSAPEFGLRSLRAMLLANPGIRHQELEAALKARDVRAEYPGVRGLGVMVRVERNQLGPFLERQKADAPEFELKTAGDAKDLYVVTAIEPLGLNRAALGFDAGSEARRRAAIEQAIATGLPTISAEVALRQEPNKHGLIFVLPIFDEGQPLATGAERLAALRAVAFAPIVAEDLFSGLLAAGDGRMLDIDIYDGSEEAPEAIIFDPDHHLELGSHGQPSHFEADSQVEVGGRTLMLHTRSTPLFDATHDLSAQRTVMGTGFVLTLLLTAVVWLLGRSRLEGLRLAEQMTRDLMEAKRRAEQLLREHAALNATIEQQFIVSVSDPQGRIISVNERLCAISGYSREELLGQDHRLLSSHTHPRAFWAEMWRTVSQGKSWRREVCNRAKSGELYWVDALITPFHDADGKIDRYVSIRADITARKNAETELAHQSELAVEYAARADEANRAKSSFLANMSHEIRTPMNGVLGMTELLLGMGLNREQEEAARTVYRSADALLVVLNDVLDFSKIEAGRLEFERLSFDVQQLAYDTMELFRGKVVGTPVELIVRVADDAPKQVWGDPSRLRQVVTNLIGNAVKFTAAGHVLLELVRKEGGRFAVRVVDTGPGIPADRQQVLFEPFTQADASTSRRFGGTGLGLAISRRLATGMGGTLALSSAPGEGSTFELELPLDEDLSADTSTLKPLAGLKVLAIERLPLQRRIMREQLLAQGATVESAIDADDALGFMSSSRFDAIVATDPNVDAVLGANPTAPVVLLTTTGPRRGADRKGLAAQVLKPCPSASLAAAILSARPSTRGTPAPALRAVPAPSAVPQGLRVLLAEDNVVNQRIARAMLERLGCLVSLVEDGRAAVEAHEDGPWDLIFMDCQMPELDGYEATIAIRAREASTGAHTPIVAMTANVMAEDRARCIAAGMDDHVAKPARAADIEGALIKWARKRAA